jgi:hypothetical protein
MVVISRVANYSSAVRITSKIDATMKFIEMTGKSLANVVNDGELHDKDFEASGVSDDSIVRVNQHGDIEVRRPHKWDVIGGLLGNFEDRLKEKTGHDWA